VIHWIGLAWDALTAAGSTLALSLIVVLALGITVMTLLFVGSAVVALEQFARTARRPSTLVFAVVGWGAVAAFASLGNVAPELAVAPWPAWFAGYGKLTAACIVAVGAVTALVSLPVRLVDARKRATACALWLGLGYGLLVGGASQPAYAAAPMVLAAAIAAMLALRRGRRANGYTPSDTERTMRLLCLTSLVGVAVALVLPEPNPVISSVGGGLLALFAAAILLGLLPLATAGLWESHRTVEWFIAVRYLMAKRRQTFISIITGICVIGIAAGVWLIITVLSVMNGFERTWREEIIGNRAHFTVHSGLGPFADYEDVLRTVEAIDDVIAVSPFIDADGMVRGAAGEIMAVRLRGVDPGRVGDVTDLRDDIIQGSLEALAPEATAPGDPPAILIGSGLAAAVGAEVGAPLLLISPFGGPQTPLGPAPRLQRFQVAGIFESSFFQYDEIYTYVNLQTAQEFRREQDVVDGIEARTTDYYRSRAVGESVEQALGFPYFTRDWKEFFPAFFQALKSERVMMFILLTMIMVVAAFSIVSTLVMMIMEKSSDIAILKAMGAEDDRIERIFAIEGTLIGLVGTGIGVIAGISVTARIGWIQEQVESALGIDTLPASVYQFSTLPSELDIGQIAIAVGLAMVLSLGATLLPSRQAARIDPVEALRYE